MTADPRAVLVAAVAAVSTLSVVGLVGRVVANSARREEAVNEFRGAVRGIDKTYGTVAGYLNRVEVQYDALEKEIQEQAAEVRAMETGLGAKRQRLATLREGTTERLNTLADSSERIGQDLASLEKEVRLMSGRESYDILPEEEKRKWAEERKSYLARIRVLRDRLARGSSRKAEAEKLLRMIGEMDKEIVGEMAKLRQTRRITEQHRRNLSRRRDALREDLGELRRQSQALRQMVRELAQ